MTLPPPDFSRKHPSVYVPDLERLTDMQARFCQEYLIDLNPKMAAIRAGYPPDKAAYAGGAVMKHPPARDLIAKLIAQRSARVGLTADRVLDRLGAIVMGDPRNVFNNDGGLIPPPQLNADDCLLIAGVKTRRAVSMDQNGKMQPEEITEVKLIDQLAALSLAMKHLGMLNEKLDVNVVHTLADRLQAAYKRKAGGRTEGPLIDGEFVEDFAHSLAVLENNIGETQRMVTHEAQPKVLTWDDVL